jgi:hypothetical protein
MANLEHVKRLHEGVSVWNKWRQEHPSLRTDLIEAKLSVGEHTRGKRLCSDGNLIW